MSKKHHISVKLPCSKKLWQAIQTKANSLDKDPVTVTIDTLNQAFGLSLTSESLPTNQELSQVKTRLAAIEQAIKPLLIDPHLSQKLVELLDKKPDIIREELPLDRGFQSSISTLNVYAASVHSLTDDDIEDEPDEILYDFLPG
ncbi:hypothetical protein [Merismopedia glauca]|uniref:Uncharacterized protein n=1 Tax=Merismopedia glauca CCAP 1448/3 TaxID=1296344 RepID=A0A2T1BZN8_9CYAN|nr:hypothetical protein [Merismopedia glauca]PSB01490.1 hypothetical protein C7B64_17995 [Merismopedia glauca CCAP 1448/3]